MSLAPKPLIIPIFNDVILATKLQMPQISREFMVRQRLVNKLGDKNTLRPLSIISAPAGFGKTTLLTRWFCGLELPVAWLSLDEEDNNT